MPIRLKNIVLEIPKYWGIILLILMILSGCQTAPKTREGRVIEDEPAMTVLEKSENNISIESSAVISERVLEIPQTELGTIPPVLEKPVSPPKPALPTYVILKAPIALFGSSNIDILDKPNPKANVITRVSPGTRLELIATEGTWMKIKTPDAKTGWVSSNYIYK